MLKFLLAVPLIMHGLANLGGVAAFLFGASAGFPDGPWLFSANVRRLSPIGRLGTDRRPGRLRALPVQRRALVALGGPWR